MEGRTLVVLILMVVTAGLLLTMQTELINVTSEESAEAACRTSVLVRGQASVEAAGGIIDVEKATPLACTSQDVGVLEGNREEQLEEVSQLAASCWWMFAEGKIDNIFKAESGEKACHICYRFRPGDNVESLSGQNLTQHMLDHNYNPSVLRGGGTHHYIGDGVGMDNLATVEPKTTVNLESIDAPELKSISFVRDPANKLTDDEKEKVNTILQDIITKTDVAGYVVVADKIRNHDRGAAQTAMEDLKLTEQGNHTKGFLLTVNLADKTARLDAGRDLTNYFSEVEIAQILQPLRTTRNDENIGGSIVAAVENIQEKLESDDKGYDPGSYYGYLANQGSFPIISNEMSSDRTQAIAYLAPSNNIGTLNNILINVGDATLETLDKNVYYVVSAVPGIPDDWENNLEPDSPLPEFIDLVMNEQNNVDTINNIVIGPNQDLAEQCYE